MSNDIEKITPIGERKERGEKGSTPSLRTTAALSGITVTIHVPDYSSPSDFSESDLITICSQIGQVASYLSGQMMKIHGEHPAVTAGAAHPVVSALFQIAQQGEACAAQLVSIQQQRQQRLAPNVTPILDGFGGPARPRK